MTTFLVFLAGVLTSPILWPVIKVLLILLGIVMCIIGALAIAQWWEINKNA